MPEIRFGAGDNMDSVMLGSIQIEEARLGSQLVWINNQGPIVIATSFRGMAFAVDMGIVEQDQVFSISAGSDAVLEWTAEDMDMPADNITQFEVIQIVGGTTTEIVRDTQPATGTTAMGTYTILASDALLYPQYQLFGDLANPDTWIIRATDDGGATYDLEFTIASVIFDPPVVSNETESATGMTVTRSATITITQSASALLAGAVAQYSTDNGVTWIDGVSVGVSATGTCGGPNGSAPVLGRSFLAGTPDVISDEVSGGLTVIANRPGSVTIRGMSGTAWTPIAAFPPFRYFISYSARRECDGTFSVVPDYSMGISFGIDPTTGASTRNFITAGISPEWIYNGVSGNITVNSATSASASSIDSTIEDPTTGVTAQEPTFAGLDSFSVTWGDNVISTATAAVGGTFTLTTPWTVNGNTGGRTITGTAYPGAGGGGRQGLPTWLQKDSSVLMGNSLVETFTILATATPGDSFGLSAAMGIVVDGMTYIDGGAGASITVV